MHRTSLLAVCLLCVLLLTGCGSSGSSASPVGSWKGAVELPPDLMGDEAANAVREALGQISMTLTADKKYTATMGMPIEGTWSITGSRLELTPQKMNGKTVLELRKIAPSNAAKIGKPLYLQMSGDGSTLTAEKEPGQRAAIVFHRE